MSRLMPSRTKPGCPVRRTRVPARKHRCGPAKSNLAAMQSVLWEKRFACAIRITGDSCCDRRASCAAACRRIRIISPLHNRAHSGAVRVTSSSSRSAEGHRETWPIRSKRFRTWLRRCYYYHATGSAPSAAAIRSALDLLEARAQFDAPERAVSTRVAEHAGRLYLDLADEHWRAVAIGP